MSTSSFFTKTACSTSIDHTTTSIIFSIVSKSRIFVAYYSICSHIGNQKYFFQRDENTR